MRKVYGWMVCVPVIYYKRLQLSAGLCMYMLQVMQDDSMEACDENRFNDGS
jgi:hypothetical protein